MFYFTCNESKIMKVSLFEISYKKKWTFHDILIYWDAPVHLYKCIYMNCLYILFLNVIITNYFIDFFL